MVTLVGQGGGGEDVTVVQGDGGDDPWLVTADQGAAGTEPWPVTDGNLPDETGTWGYRAGTSGTPSIPAGARVLGIAAIPAAGGGTLTIDGGDTVTVPEGFPLDWSPRAQLVAPTLVFTGTQSYVVEFLT